MTMSAVGGATLVPAPGFEAVAARWVGRLALLGGLGVMGLWWTLSLGDLNPQQAAEAKKKEREEAKRAKQEARENARKSGVTTGCADCDCDAVDCVDVGDCGCAAADCAGADCSGCSGVDCAGADCSGCSGADCGAADCGSCDCGSVDCGSVDCGGCAMAGVRMRGVHLAGASTGATVSADKGIKCSRRGNAVRSALLIAAPLFVLGTWHGLAVRSARRKAREQKESEAKDADSAL